MAVLLHEFHVHVGLYLKVMVFHDEDNMEYIVRVGSERDLGQEYPPARF